MARKVFRKPRFISLLSTGTPFHFPKDQILVKWEVRGALFVKTSITGQRYATTKTITLPVNHGYKQITVTAVGILGKTTKTLVLRDSVLETAPNFADMHRVQLHSKEFTVGPSKLPSKVGIDAKFKFLDSQKVKLIQVISAVHIHSDNGTMGNLSGLKINLPEINIYE